jgi:hypothetical protein
LCIEALKNGWEFPKIPIPKPDDVERYSRMKLLQKRRDKDKLFCDEKWSKTMEDYNATIVKNMENNNRIHLQRF